MDSEKVKEIKKALQDHSIEKLKYQDGIKVKEIDFIDILTLINELESENERLSEDLKFQQMIDKAYKYNMACENGKQFKQISELKEENTKLKDRIAELEEYIKGNEQDAKAFVNGWHKDLETELKQFAEKLKKKVIKYRGVGCGVHPLVFDIDETLKEFING